MVNTIAVIVVVLLAVLLVALLGVAATRPDTFRVQRTTSIDAPPGKVFPLINDLRRWSAWSPYERKDPAMKRTFSGAASGPGAAYEWDGNREIGRGRMEITESSPPSRVTIKLDFVKPFEAHNVVEFTLDARGEATNVTWALHGPASYMSKIMSVFFSMERMVGRDFESGLANLKAVAEAS
jgi:uncharacterized protein YndB with AHSA1/START domain